MQQWEKQFTSPRAAIAAVAAGATASSVPVVPSVSAAPVSPAVAMGVVADLSPIENFSGGYENFIPALASSYNYQLNNLMDQEDQDYYLGEQWFPPTYYTNRLYMQEWEKQFTSPRAAMAAVAAGATASSVPVVPSNGDLLINSSTITPMRRTPRGSALGLSLAGGMELPNGLTSERNMVAVETGKSFT